MLMSIGVWLFFVVVVCFYFHTTPMVSALKSKAALRGTEITDAIMEAHDVQQ